MRQVIEFARKVAPLTAAVLITGETGSGKELIARLIHQHSSRRNKPWVDVNCAALPEHLVESELFGYEKGAFSGADSAKAGLFEIANGGTLFLDEIGDLEPKVQVKLLRVLDSVPYYRLGGNRKVSVDVRILAATNRDLQAAVRSGAFRRDLYHRITEVQVQVPPLRERPEDIAALAIHFLQRFCPGTHFAPGGAGAVVAVHVAGQRSRIAQSHPEPCHLHLGSGSHGRTTWPLACRWKRLQNRCTAPAVPLSTNWSGK